jgi:hypothetical protein
MPAVVCPDVDWDWDRLTPDRQPLNAAATSTAHIHVLPFIKNLREVVPQKYFSDRWGIM